MNKLRQLCAGLILTLALTSTVFAGQMDCPGVVQSPPDNTTTATQSSSVMDSTTTDALLVVIGSAFLVP